MRGIWETEYNVTGYISWRAPELTDSGACSRKEGTMKKRLFAISLFLIAALAVFSVCSAEEMEQNLSGSYIHDSEFSGFMYIRCSTPLLYKSREAVFTVVTDCSGEYTYRFVLSGATLQSNIDIRQEYNINNCIIAEETNTTGVMRFRPRLSDSIYNLQVYITDSEGHENVLQDYYLCCNPADIGDESTIPGKVAAIVQECRAMEFEDEYDIALYMHDWLTRNAGYDHSLQQYAADGVLMQGTGICQSYADAYRILMEEMGIPCITVFGKAGEYHAWNMIELNGVWGHVDCTWDDPANKLGESGPGNRVYFYVSDEVMAETRTWERNSYPECPKQLSICEKYGHRITDIEAEAPTCSKPGHPAYRICTRCDYSTYDEDALTPPTGHTFADGVCTVCGTDEIVTDGTLGSLYWKLDANGNLSISGSGRMERPSGSQFFPWHPDYLTQIKCIDIGPDVTYIGRSAFARCSHVTQITIPAGITSIGYMAFRECVRLEDAVLPEGLTKIEIEMFDNCVSLRHVYIPDSVTVIESSAFFNCTDLPEISLPAGLTSIGNCAFALCKSLESITVPPGTAFIGDSAFEKCPGLTSITLPLSLTEIGYDAFCDSGLTDVYYEGTEADRDRIKGIEKNDELLNAVWHYGAVIYGHMDTLTLPSSVTQIGSEAFSGTAAQVIIIPASCLSVSEDAFTGCNDLVYIVNRSSAAVTAPAGVTVLDESGN